jgi:hypothetical protein
VFVILNEVKNPRHLSLVFQGSLSLGRDDSRIGQDDGLEPNKRPGPGNLVSCPGSQL